MCDIVCSRVFHYTRRGYMYIPLLECLCASNTLFFWQVVLWIEMKRATERDFSPLITEQVKGEAVVATMSQRRPSVVFVTNGLIARTVVGLHDSNGEVVTVRTNRVSSPSLVMVSFFEALMMGAWYYGQAKGTGTTTELMAALEEHFRQCDVGGGDNLQQAPARLQLFTDWTPYERGEAESTNQDCM